MEKPLLSSWTDRRDTWAGFALQTAAGIAVVLVFFTLAAKVSSDFIYFQF